MKIGVKKSFFYVFVASICNLTVLCVAQTNAEDGKSLWGNWTFDNVTAHEGNVLQAFNTDGLGCCGVPVEMNIRQDEITFVWKGHTEKVPFNSVVKAGNLFCFPICAEWTVADNKLQLKWKQDIEGPDPKMLAIVLTYKIK